VIGRLRFALLAVGLALAVLAYRVQVHDGHSRGDHALIIDAVAVAFLVAGVVAWARREQNRLGPLMVATGFALLVRQFRYSHEAFLFTACFALGDLGYALAGHSVLAYPAGRVTGWFQRALVAAGYTTVLVFPLAVLLFHPQTQTLLQFNPRDLQPHRSLLLLHADGRVAELLQKTEIVIFYGVLSALFVGVIAYRLYRATPRARRILAPLLLAAVALALRGVFEGVFAFRDQRVVNDEIFWWQISGFVALPLALLGGMLRARLARAGVGDLLVELERTPPHRIQEALARTLGDRSLEVALWLPERHEFVDVAGRPFALPKDETRAVTQLESDGEPFAALVHDPSLLDEPKLVESAGAAARLALENARLHAEMRAQLVQVQESRQRIVAAADDERRRIERDLHDGAQQRLVALALQLRSAQRRLGAQVDPEVERVLDAAVGELQGAVAELRELARGVHPAILTEEGLAAALESLTSRTPLPVALDVLDERLSTDVEATAYFVACEALANIVKHAHASHAKVAAARRNGLLVVEVEDDGVGGASLDGGSGLRGLVDRVEALGGQLRIESAAGSGTRVVGEIPCAS
jgi:signal transduction histidine kinase